MYKNILSILDFKKAVGLYVSQDTVDLVVLKSGFGGASLVKFGQTYIYPKEVKDLGEITPEVQAGNVSISSDNEVTKPKTREEYTVEAIKRVFAENKVKLGNVITAIPSEETMVRYFQMPKIPKQERESAVNFEAKRYIPFRMEDVISDFQVLPSRTEQNSMDVVFVAARKNIMEQYLNMLYQAGLKPIIVEPAPFSLMRALNAAHQIDIKVNTAIVNITLNTLNINILRRGVPYIIRDVPLSGSEPLGQSLEPVFEKILAEIKLSFDFYEKQFPSEIIDKIIVYSKFTLENWHEIVGKELQIPVEIGEPTRGIRVTSGVIPARLAICFGLALRGLSEPFIDINLGKEKLLIYKKKELFLKIILLEASLAVFLLVVLKIVTMRMTVPLSDELSKTLSERPKTEINIKSDNISDLEKLKNEIDSRKKVLENLISTKIYLTPKLQDIVSIIPKDMWLSEVNFEERVDKKNPSRISRSLDIKGYYLVDEKMSGDKDLVNIFLKKLKSSEVSKGLPKADILSVKKIDMEDKKIASFEILFTGQEI